MKFADPTNDIAFKKIFGDENHTNILISFLNSTLDFKGNNKIKSITIANPYQVPKIEELKNTILDINAIDNNNNHFVVEMQVQKDKHFSKRSLYYTSKSYVNQINQGEEYRKLKKVYFIGILDFAIFNTNDYISRHLILDAKTFSQELKDFEFTFIELKKFDKELKDCATIVNKWIYFIKNAGSFELIPKEFKDIDEFNTACEIAMQQKWSKKELEVYEYVSIREGRRVSELETAKQDGIEQGVVKGIKQGIEQEKINIAKNLLDILDNKTIAIKTNLSIEDIEKLR